MDKNTKKVNVYSSNVLTVFTPPMEGVFLGIEMTCGDILFSIRQGARIFEVLPNGNLVRLNQYNYNQDNTKAPVEEIDIPKVDNSKIVSTEQITIKESLNITPKEKSIIKEEFEVEESIHLPQSPTTTTEVVEEVKHEDTQVEPEVYSENEDESLELNIYEDQLDNTDDTVVLPETENEDSHTNENGKTYRKEKRRK